jgi:hypothetical protein
VRGALPATIAPGQSAALRIAFDPTTIGHQQATVSVLSDDLNEPSFQFAVAGLGYDGPNLTGQWSSPVLKIARNATAAPGSAAPSLLKTKFMVYNNGSQPAHTDSGISVYLSDDAKLDANDTQLGIFSAGAVRPPKYGKSARPKQIRVAPRMPLDYVGKHLIAVIESPGDALAQDNIIVIGPLLGS